MATGETLREVVSDPNAPNKGNAPRQRLSIGGIQSPRGPMAPTRDQGLDSAISALSDVGAKIASKRKNADFIDGQMASMSGKTQDEVAAEGNRTTMAGFVSLEVGNAVSEWQTNMLQAAANEHYGESPEAYNKRMSASAAELISKVGSDPYAREQMTKSLAPAMQRLAATQAATHAQYTETETVNAYTNTLLQSGQAAAINYDGGATGTPAAGASVANGDYKAYAQGYVDQIIQVESGGRANAQNADSSAGGVGQFIDSTWIAMIRKHRPDLAGRSRQEILDLKFNAKLNKEMTVAYTAENAYGLASSGLQVNPGNSYLAHFAGLGGARRVLKGDPNLPVSTTLTKGQIAANKSIMYKNGRMITNGELQAWAHRKMGNKAGVAKNVRQTVLSNPGLPPATHRKAVVDAMVTSLAAGDGSLYQTAGGLEGLADLNLSAADNARITRAHDTFQKERQNAYNMDYERQRHDIVTKAASGDYSEDEVFDMLEGLNSTYGRSDQDMLRTHSAVQQALDGRSAGIWQEPERQYDLMTIRQGVFDGEKTVEEAMAEVQEIGEMYGASAEETEKSVANIIAAHEKVKNAERAEVEKATRAGLKVKQTRDSASDLISRNALGTGSKAEQQEGVKLLEGILIEEAQAAGIAPEEMTGHLNERMSKVLVKNNVVDAEQAAEMAGALGQPLDKDGKVTASAHEAFAYYLDLKAAGADGAYLSKMFKGREGTLAMLADAEIMHRGDGSLDVAMAKAYALSTTPASAETLAANVRKIDNGEYRESVKNAVLKSTGLLDTVWNGIANIGNFNWNAEHMSEEDVDRAMQDVGLDKIIEQQTRATVALYPNASTEAVGEIVAGQIAEQTTVLGGTLIMSDRPMRDIMGLRSKEPEAPNAALVQYVTENGEELFGPEVWGNIGPGLFTSRPEFTTEMVQGNLIVTPVAVDGVDQTSRVLSAKEVGAWYNAKQLEDTDSVLNTIVDFFRVDQPHVPNPHFQ